MHKLLAAAVALIAATASAADFEGVMDSKMTVQSEKQATSGTGRIYMGKGGVRVEMQMAMPVGQGPAGEVKMTSLVLKSKPGVVYLVNDAKKTYAEIENKQDASQAATEKYTVKKLGSEKVAGYDCGHGLVADEKGEQFEVWTTKDIGGAAEYWASQRGRAGNRAAMYDALRGAGLDGWPMKWLHRSGKEGQSVFEITKVQRQAVPASLFDLSGYKKSEGGVMGMSQQMQLSPEQQKQMDEAMKRRDEAMKNMSPEQRKKMEELMKSYGK
jgi:hypothetical protein